MKTLILPMLFSCFIQIGYGQNFTICGDSSNEYYYDFSPDLQISYRPSPLYGIDVTDDMVADFRFLYYTIDQFGGYYMNVKSMNGSIETAYYSDTTLDWTKNQAFGFAAGDTIKNSSDHISWEHEETDMLSENGRGYWFNGTALYYAYRLLSGQDTTYGWFYIDCFESSSYTIYDACGVGGHRVNPIYAEDRLLLYPNPATDFLSFRLNTEGSYTIASIEGKVYLTGDFQYYGQRSVRTLPNGVYIFTAFYGDKKESATFIKQ